jgi:hypothetical protein
MTVELLVDCLTILVAVCRLYGMGAGDSRSLRLENYVGMKELVRRSTYYLIPFRPFFGDMRREFMQLLLCGSSWHLGIMSS